MSLPSLEINNTIIEIRDDGYVNLTMICTAGEKKISHWNSTAKKKKFIQLLSDDTGIPVDRLIESSSVRSGGFERGTFAHPRVALNVAQWVSIAFEIEVSRWIEEWRDYKDNDTRYRTSLNSIQPEDCNAHIERDIQHRLQKDVGGEIEVETTIGYIDLLTDTMLIEIKEASQWKHGLGQVLCYSNYESRDSYRLHLFGELPVSKKDIENTCGRFGVIVTYE
jgi:hypothetical protein